MNPFKEARDNGFCKTARRVITRRGVLWLGQTCNIRCHFCYFLDRIQSSGHPEHPFMSLDKAKSICWNVRYYYDNNAIDIQGGEPLLFKGIYDLTIFCHEIGLLPTLITNGILLAKRDTCFKLKDSGVRDLLVSVHALGDVYDTIVGTPGASVKQMQGLRNCIDVGLPFRFNVVLSKWALPQYVDIAKLAVETGARVVNFIAFNPFEDQASGKRSSENVATYTEVAAELKKALDVLERADVEANVRYVPLCIVEERHRKSMYNFQQLPYDLHEWDYASWSWTGQTPQRMRDGDCLPLIALEDATYAHGRPLSGFPNAEKLGLAACFGAAKRYVYEKLAPFPRVRNSAQQLYHTAIEAVMGQGKPREAGEGVWLERDPALYRANARLRAEVHCKYVYSHKCGRCSVKPICDGFHGDYVSLFGAEEARPIDDISAVDDPCHFIRAQLKVVESEDYDWCIEAGTRIPDREETTGREGKRSDSMSSTEQPCAMWSKGPEK